jgi:hypothetical protein
VLGQVRDDLAVAEDAHGDRDEADAVGQLGDVERVAGDTRVDVGAHQPHQQPEQDHADGLEQGARCQHHRADQAQHHQRKVFSRAKLEGHLGQRRGEGRQNQRAHATREERAQAGSGQRRPRTPLSRHLVAVDRGDH